MEARRKPAAVLILTSLFLSKSCAKSFSLKAWKFNILEASFFSFSTMLVMFPASFRKVVPSNILWKPGSITVDSQGPTEHVFTVVSLAHFLWTNSWEKEPWDRKIKRAWSLFALMSRMEFQTGSLTVSIFIHNLSEGQILDYLGQLELYNLYAISMISTITGFRWEYN